MSRRRPTQDESRPTQDERRDTGTPATAGTGARQPRTRNLEGVPAWIQAVAAICGVALTALVVFGLVRDPKAPTPPPASPAGGSPAALAPKVTLETIEIGETVRATGTYEALDPTREGVLLIGQPSEGQDGDWLPVLASLIPSTGETVAGRQSGRWEAVRPDYPGGRYTWYAVAAPASAGAGDPYADIRANGPDSDLVLARSEPRTTD